MNPFTLGSLIEFSGAHVEQGIAEYAKETNAKADSPSWPGFVAETAAKELNEKLNIDVFDLFADAWATFRQVRDCADRSKHPPEETAVVRLTGVEITSSNAPFLKATWYGIPLHELKFTLDLVARFEALELVIRDARIRALRPGAASALVCLKYGKKKLGEQATPHWNLPGEIKLPGDGIPIAREH